MPILGARPKKSIPSWRVRLATETSCRSSHKRLYGKLGMSEADVKAMAETLKNQIPAKRFGEPREVADAVVYFASDESAFTVGSELVIDGGMYNL